MATWYSHLKNRYGITKEEWLEMAEEQGWVCAICEEPCSAKGRLSVDHDHETGAIRGLLCHHCNVFLGYAKNDVGRLEAAAKYLLKQENLLETIY